MKPSIRLIGHVTAQHFGLTWADLVARGRTKHLALARSVAMKLARLLTDKTQAQIAMAFKRERTTVRHAAARELPEELMVAVWVDLINDERAWRI